MKKAHSYKEGHNNCRLCLVGKNCASSKIHKVNS